MVAVNNYGVVGRLEESQGSRRLFHNRHNRLIAQNLGQQYDFIAVSYM